MSTQGVQAAAQRPGRAVKTVAKTADFKGALARAQAPFAPAPARPAQIAASTATGTATGTAAVGGDATFRGRIAALESAGAGWAARNPTSGALGRYQFMPIALRDIGWQDGTGAWTDRAAAAGVRSENDFLSNPTAQEKAMSDYLLRAEQQLSANGSLRAAGQTVTATDGRAVPLTEAGLVAAAHRRGAGAVARWLDHRTRTPEAPVPEATRVAFADVEQRLRDFAGVAYATRAGISPSA